uniref:laccase n=1 Tax=Fagus sylvatica TaxID=28930 RepID=A0A2N9EE45_FAGSY
MLLQPLIASRAPRMGLVGLSPPENGYGAKEIWVLGVSVVGDQIWVLGVSAVGGGGWGTRSGFWVLRRRGGVGIRTMKYKNYFTAGALLWPLAALSGMLFCMAQANIHYYDFVLKETNFTRLCGAKSMLTVNGSFPGPVICIHKGDTVYVNVQNQGNYGVTIHWHGVKQPRNPESDGPEFITQCPISLGSNFTYKIIFLNEEGTLWWHAHSDWTRASVHGAIVILPANGTAYPFPNPDGEQVIVFGSWYKGDVMSLTDNASKTGGATLLSDAFTINGQPGDYKPCSKETTYLMVVDYGKTYLLRNVNAAMNRDFFFAISEHNLTVVGWDGAYVKPFTTGYIMIAPRQTMDILVTANQSPSTQYYMLISPYYDGALYDFDQSIATAIWQYNGNYTFPSTPSYPANLPHYALQ